jgi:hypothetical protein
MFFRMSHAAWYEHRLVFTTCVSYHAWQAWAKSIELHLLTTQACEQNPVKGSKITDLIHFHQKLSFFQSSKLKKWKSANFLKRIWSELTP